MNDQWLLALFTSANFFIGVVLGARWWSGRLGAIGRRNGRRCDGLDCIHVHKDDLRGYRR